MITKTIIMTFIVLLCVGTTYAQDIDTVKGINSKGLKIGFGSSMMNAGYEELETFFDYKIGFHGGAFLTYQVNPKFSIQPELLLSVKGTNQGGIISLLDWSISYLEIPLLVKYNFVNKKKLKPFLYVGPSISYMLSSEFEIIFADPFDVTDFMNKIDFGVVFGEGGGEEEA